MDNERFFFTLAEDQAKMAKCPRASVGCVIVLGGEMILSTGFNGAPAGQVTCLDDGCIIEGGHCVRAVHAEARAIALAAKRGIRLDGAEAYVTLLPCINCMNALIIAGVKMIYYDQSYERAEKDWLHQLARSAHVRLIERTR